MAEGPRGKVHKEGTLTVQVGDEIPSISLPSTSGENVNLREEADKHHLVLFYYPGDKEGERYGELSGCSGEGRSFRDNMESIRQMGAVVYGVNLHTTERQKEFIERERLNFELLSDANRELANALGIPIWTSDAGETFSSRNTFIVQKGGRIIEIFADLSTSQGHVEDVMAALTNV